MNKLALGFLAVACMASTPAHAAFDWFGGRLSVGGGYGRGDARYPYSYKDAYKDGPVWQGHIQYFLNDNLSLVAQYHDIRITQKGTHDDLIFRPLTALLRVNVFHNLPVSPYFVVGGGASFNKKERTGLPKQRWNKLVGQAGVGMEFFINEGTSLGAEALYHQLVAENAARDYGIATVVGTVNFYFGAGPQTLRAREESRRAREELAASQKETSLAQRQTTAATSAASQQVNEAEAKQADAERRLREMQNNAKQAQLEVNRIKEATVRKDIPPINFATGSATLLPNASAALDRIADVIKRYPNLAVQVEGHTDNIGNAQINQSLSERRAQSVQKYLANRAGTSSNDNIRAVGMGSDNPVASNATNEGRLQNRRVEFIFMTPSGAGTTTTAP